MSRDSRDGGRCRAGDRADRIRLEDVGDIADGELVVRVEDGLGHARPVDADAIHAPQIADEIGVVDLRDTTVAAGHLGAVRDDNVTIGVTTNQDDGFVEQDWRTTGKWCQACGHVVELRLFPTNPSRMRTGDHLPTDGRFPTVCYPGRRREITPGFPRRGANGNAKYGMVRS